jgi:lipoprotein-anchoring transpeptidase ErfK/SrfK
VSRKVALLLTLVSGVGLAVSPAAAASYYPSYNNYYYFTGQRPQPRAVPRAALKPAPKPAVQSNQAPFGDVPKGTAQIVVSIDQQKLALYSNGVLIADSPIASGVPQLPTPLGVFSVIQKQRYHESNIYSNAPMPFMQRITWSGVALHEGENIGHPASHGCVRLPHDFAERLFYFTKVGVPVIIARPELRPVAFDDPHLFVHKDAAPPTPPAPAPVAAAPEQAPQAAPVASVDPVKAADKVADAASDKTPAKADTKATDAAPVATTDPAKSADTAAADKTAAKSDDKATDAAPIAVTYPAKPVDKTADAAADKTAAKVDDKATDAAPPIPIPAAALPAVTPVIATSAAVDPNKLGLRISDTNAVPKAKPDPIKTVPVNKDPIAIFISRKEKKIYVRQDFTPLFSFPVTFIDPDKPLGTHAFTALDYAGDDHSALHWNVVSLPGEPPPASKSDKRAAKNVAAVRRSDDSKAAPLPPPQTPAEALARIDIPQDAIDAVSQRIVPGSTLVVSDHGLGDETGDGTNFIVETQ